MAAFAAVTGTSRRKGVADEPPPPMQQRQNPLRCRCECGGGRETTTAADCSRGKNGEIGVEVSSFAQCVRRRARFHAIHSFMSRQVFGCLTSLPASTARHRTHGATNHLARPGSRRLLTLFHIAKPRYTLSPCSTPRVASKTSSLMRILHSQPHERWKLYCNIAILRRRFSSQGFFALAPALPVHEYSVLEYF